MDLYFLRQEYNVSKRAGKVHSMETLIDWMIRWDRWFHHYYPIRISGIPNVSMDYAIFEAEKSDFLPKSKMWSFSQDKIDSFVL